MNKELIGYLQRIGARDPQIGRINQIFTFYKNICDEKIEDIFVSEYRTKEGERNYENLWLFTSSYIMEAKAFLNKEDFDIMPFTNELIYLQLLMQKYDFKRATDDSRFTLVYHCVHTLQGELKSTGENCDHLKYIIDKYFKPKI